MEAGCVNVEAAAGPAGLLRWNETIGRVFGAVDMKIPGGAGFSGRARVTSFGEVDVTHVACSGEDASRRPQHIARDAKDFHVLAFVRKGAVAIRQAGRECVATAGSSVLFDLQRPYHYVHADWSEVLSVKIPGDALRSRLRCPEGRLIDLRDAGKGLGRVVRDSLESLVRESESVPPLLRAQLANRIVDLVAIGLESENHDAPVGESASRSALYRRALAFIDNHLADPDLDPARIAAAVGISVRYLHRIFEEQSRSVGAVLRARRLSLSYEALLASRAAPIKEMAYRFGFRSHAHFCTAFRQEFAQTPSDVQLGRAAPGQSDAAAAFEPRRARWPS